MSNLVHINESREMSFYVKGEWKKHPCHKGGYCNEMCDEFQPTTWDDGLIIELCNGKYVSVWRNNCNMNYHWGKPGFKKLTLYIVD